MKSGACITKTDAQCVYDEATIADGSSSPLDRSSRWLGVLRLFHELSDRYQARRHRGCGTHTGSSDSRGREHKTMIDRVEAQFDIKPERLIGDTAYRSQMANRDNLLIALITLLLVWVNRQVSVETSVERNANDRGRGYLQAFPRSLETRLRDHLTIEQYAVDVGISAAYLNALCRKQRWAISLANDQRKVGAGG